MMTAAYCVTTNRQRRRRRSRRATRRRRSERPTLRFTPYAWAKLLYLRDAGDTEIGGFGISAPNDLLRIEDVCLVRQQCHVAAVRFDDEAVADFFDAQVDAGRRPEQFGRIWLHTHPDDSARPSLTDGQTFQRSFGGVDWAVMFILARSGETSARLRFNVGPQADQSLEVAIDFTQPFAAPDVAAWQRVLESCVRPVDIDPWSAGFADEVAAEYRSAELDALCSREWLDRGEADPLFSEEADFPDDLCSAEEDAWQTRLSAVPG